MHSDHFVDERLRFASFILNVSFHEALRPESFARQRAKTPTPKLCSTRGILDSMTR
jgi:hypothetical protein